MQLFRAITRARRMFSASLGPPGAIWAPVRALHACEKYRLHQQRHRPPSFLALRPCLSITLPKHCHSFSQSDRVVYDDQQASTWAANKS